MSDIFLFAIFPYLAIVVFLIGTIYRYNSNPYKFSSLSAEFLEGRQLYWGTMPFHIGILSLFFGHLIAFLFPDSVIAWNSQPVRLIILELTAFIFGLSCLIGVFLLFKRRLLVKRIRVVSNFMDYLVLGLLLTQIVSGLWVAYFNRWGSSWFAAILTPYLRSLFEFNPEIDAVQTLPFSIKLHIISAISIIAIIPFTRLVHFLVPPISYIWRDYQQVIWNKKQVVSGKS